jgi:hypothetical protein
MRMFLAFFLLVISSFSVSAGTVYRWVDADGKVYYSGELPPPNAKGVQEKKVSAGGVGEENLPYAVKLAAQKYPVTLYVTDCGEPCDKAREHLAKRGVPHSSVDPQKPEGAEALKKLIGGLDVPVLVIGSTVSKGYQASGWDAALDAAGYPKSNILPKTAPKKQDTAPAKPADTVEPSTGK